MVSGGWNKGYRTGVAICCPCGKGIYASPSTVGRKKFCSNECKYRYRTRRSGLKYTIHKENSGWFKPREQQQ